MRSRLVVLVPALAFLVACGSDGGAGNDAPLPPSASLDGGASESDPNVVSFESTVEPLTGFHFDTGMIPHGSSVAVDFGITEKGKLTVDAKADSVGTRSAPGLRPIPRTGKIALEIHYQLKALLHVDVSKIKYDGPLPNIENVDIHFTGYQAFDPFLLNGGSVDMQIDPHNSALPSIGLPKHVPGSLTITVTDKSKFALHYEGVCAASSDGTATYEGRATTEGTLNLKASIDLSVGPVGKTFDLGSIDVPVPPASVSLSATATADLFEGALLPSDVVNASCGVAPIDAGTP